MSKIAQSTILLTITIAILGVVGGIGYFVYSEIVSYQTAIQSLNTDIYRVTHTEVQSKKILDTLVTTKKSRDALGTHFVTDDGIVSFIQTIEAVGPKMGVQAELSSLTADDTTDASKATPSIAKAHLQARGSWTNIMRYIPHDICPRTSSLEMGLRYRRSRF